MTTIDYKQKWNDTYCMIESFTRIRLSRARKKDLKEIKLLFTITTSLGMDDLQADLRQLWQQIEDNEKARKLAAVERMGYTLTKDKKN